jgi:hypothetical protein
VFSSSLSFRVSHRTSNSACAQLFFLRNLNTHGNGNCCSDECQCGIFWGRLGTPLVDLPAPIFHFLARRYRHLFYDILGARVLARSRQFLFRSPGGQPPFALAASVAFVFAFPCPPPPDPQVDQHGELSPNPLLRGYIKGREVIFCVLEARSWTKWLEQQAHRKKPKSP